MAYSSIVKPSVYFNTLLYTGNGATSSAGSTARTLTGVGFQPDWVWVKERSNTEQPFLQDVVRGASKILSSSGTAAEVDVLTDYSDGGINGFVSDGFTLGSGTSGNANNINTNSETYVAWNWKANGAGSANTSGSINSTVSVNTTAGFSIVSWTGNAVTGATIGHGLGVKPNMIILKNRGPDTSSWPIYHSSLGATKYLSLNATNGSSTSSTRWNNAEPSTTVFTTGSSGDVKGDNSGEPFIAYCFAEKKGYSKFGSYIGNSANNAEAPFVYTGFKPAFVMIKNKEQASAWEMYDKSRDGFNPKVHGLRANANDTEDNTDDLVDLLSNGFKLRHQGSGINENNDEFIYMAFAEEPLVANVGQSIPATAR